LLNKGLVGIIKGVEMWKDTLPKNPPFDCDSKISKLISSTLRLQNALKDAPYIERQAGGHRCSTRRAAPRHRGSTHRRHRGIMQKR
jgi:hypothetical protein